MNNGAKALGFVLRRIATPWDRDFGIEEGKVLQGIEDDNRLRLDGVVKPVTGSGWGCPVVARSSPSGKCRVTYMAKVTALGSVLCFLFTIPLTSQAAQSDELDSNDVQESKSWYADTWHSFTDTYYIIPYIEYSLVDEIGYQGNHQDTPNGIPAYPGLPYRANIGSSYGVRLIPKNESTHFVIQPFFESDSKYLQYQDLGALIGIIVGSPGGRGFAIGGLELGYLTAPAQRITGRNEYNTNIDYFSIKSQSTFAWAIKVNEIFMLAHNFCILFDQHIRNYTLQGHDSTPQRPTSNNYTIFGRNSTQVEFNEITFNLGVGYKF